MGSTTSFSGRFTYAGMRNEAWSRTEKVVARKAFERALRRELNEVLRKAKQMASMAQRPSDLWALEEYLGRCRRHIDRKYDYRYSILHEVFGNLIREGRLSMEDLHGLAEEKLQEIRRASVPVLSD